MGTGIFEIVDDVRREMTAAQVSKLHASLPVPAVAVPTVSRAQARLALLEAGLLDDVEDAIAAMEGEAGRRARIEWADRVEFRRDHELIVSLATVLGLSDAQVDALFERAAML